VAAAVARLKTLVATAPFPPQVRRPRYPPPPPFLSAEPEALGLGVRSLRSDAAPGARVRGYSRGPSPTLASPV
jgi:hypothetical protein